MQADRLTFLRCGQGGVSDRVDDRERGEQAGDDREQDRGAHADQADEREREQRAADRAEVVHRAFEPVGAAVDGGRDDVREQRVASWDSQSAGGPRAGAQDRDLPDGGGRADQA